MSASRIGIVSHRGLGYGHRENSLAAFRAVAAEGRFGVELDARITRDGVAVVCHDPELHGPGGESFPIAETDAAELAGLVPTLADALAALRGVLVDLEIKPTEAPLDPILDVLGDARVRFSSFSSLVLSKLRTSAPAMERALLLEPGVDLPWSTSEATLVGARAVHPHRSLLSPAHVQGWRAAGLSVRAYTLNDADEWAYARDLGIDAIITDVPVELERFLDAASDGRRG